MTKTAERDEAIDFSYTYYLNGQNILVNTEYFSSEGDDAERIARLNNSSIGVIQGTTSVLNIEQFATERGITIDRAYFTVHLEAIQSLSDGRIDGFTNDYTALQEMAKDNKSLVVLLDENFTKAPYGIGIPPGHQRLQELVNETLLSMQADGTYDEIALRWFPNQTPYTITDDPESNETLKAVATATPRPTETLSPLPTFTRKPTATATPTFVANNNTLTVSALSVNIRSGPGTSYGIVGAAVAGEEYSVTGQVSNCQWYQIDHPELGTTWIAGGDFSKANGDCATIPAISVTPTAVPTATAVLKSATTDPTDPFPADKGCLLLQNQLGPELTFSFTSEDGRFSDTVQVTSDADYPYCLDPGSYRVTVDAPPPWADINEEFTITAGDRFFFPIRPR